MNYPSPTENFHKSSRALSTYCTVAATLLFNLSCAFATHDQYGIEVMQ